MACSEPPPVRENEDEPNPVDYAEDQDPTTEDNPASPPPIDDPLANGLKALFDPSIRQTTEKLAELHQSQVALSDEFDRLISQLQHYLDSTEPPSIKPTVAKLASTSKRLTAVNNSLQNIQQRLNRAFAQLSKHRAS